jgi:ribosome biogenesis GTPase
MSNANNDRTRQGFVVKKMMGIYTVRVDEKSIPCTLASHFAKSTGAKPERFSEKKAFRSNEKKDDTIDDLVVGDDVILSEQVGNTGRILEVLPRRTRFSRRAAAPMPGRYPREQVLAANVKQVVPVFAVSNPPPRWNMLDRYLVSAEAFGLEAIICLTKSDLLAQLDDEQRADLEKELSEYQRIGYRVIRVSTFSGNGLADLKQALHGSLSVLLGKSGVGKTSLLNALQPGLGLKVNSVSQMTGKGRHTTSAQEMFLLDWGGAIVDTPGEREFGLWDVDTDDLALFFPEMRPFVGRCRFGMNCRHDEEPDCAVRTAAMSGKISPRRYHSFQRLRVDP